MTGSRGLAALAVAGPVLFTLAWLVLGAATGGYSQPAETISALAAPGSPGRPAMVAGMAVLTLSLAGTALLVGRSGRYAVPTTALLIAGTAGSLVATVFPTGCTNPAWCDPVSSSPVGTTHAVGAGLLFVGLPVAMLTVAVTRGAGRAARWCSAATFAVAAPLLAWFVLGPDDWSGLAEKIFLTVLLVWTAALGLSARRPAPTPWR
ncbi:MAG: DUF998 domain-containing protein, partial [Actinocatenispora sp.]